MSKRILSALSALLVSYGVTHAITYTYGELNPSTKTCTLLSWGGSQPTSGKLTLKETYEENGVTYTVTAIAAHALDNLTEVTEITIPSGVVSIGDARESYDASALNFNNCPKLVKFKVVEGNPQFQATADGILTRGHSNMIVRVPEGFPVTGGRYLMPADFIVIHPDAFAGNNTISVLSLSPNLWSFNSNCGFNDMKLLSMFSINGTTAKSYTVSNGTLYNKDKTEIISYPPRNQAATYTISDGIKKIGMKAFANNASLKQIDFNQVEEIGEYAFSGCGFTTMELPNRTVKLDEGTFSDCKSLWKLFIPASVDLPKNFARNCSALTQVTMTGTTVTFKDCAFKGCRKLENFGFNTSMTFNADSIFADCGFKEIIWSPGKPTMKDLTLGTAMFSGCENLRKIDLSGILVGEGTSFSIHPMCTSECPALKEVILPRWTSFWSSSKPDFPNFGFNSSIDHLEIGAFSMGQKSKPLFIYDEGIYSPTVFLKITDATSQSWPVGHMFMTSGSAFARPVIVCERYNIAYTVGYDDEDYILPNAIYYIPGGTFDNYSKLIDHNCTVFEMYSVETINAEGNFKLILTPKVSDGLTFGGITVNNSYVGEPDADGTLITDIPFESVDSYTVNYTYEGVALKTIYPKPEYSAIKDAGESDAVVNGQYIYAGENATGYVVYDFTGRIISIGSDQIINLAGLINGIYVVKIKYAGGKEHVMKIVR